MRRRTFVELGVAAGLARVLPAAEGAKPTGGKEMKETIVVAADPFALGLEKAVVAHLRERGFAIRDYGATEADANKPYYRSAVDACRALQRGEATRMFLFCGTGMGMSMIANRFRGVRAAVVESVFAAKMCRAINDANVCCMGQMIWGDMMAIAAADAFLDTAFAEGLEPLAGFLAEARRKVADIRD
ncbi:MAG: RpiB/LacA/LacB family sugar-phosphate isomerase [Kiritimatiellia bacterium]